LCRPLTRASLHFSQTALTARIQGLARSLRAGWPTGQPVWRPALRFSALCENCRLERIRCPWRLRCPCRLRLAGLFGNSLLRRVLRSFQLAEKVEFSCLGWECVPQWLKPTLILLH
jgi:hypothetical protein